MFNYATIIRWLCIAPIATVLAVADARAASSVLIWPVNPVIFADQQAAALWLENRGADAAHLQIRVVGWEQANNENLYRDQKEVIGTPPVVKIEAGKRQLVRLTRIVPALPGVERAYRVIVDEIPVIESKKEGETGPAVNFQMRYSVPLFVEGAGLDSRKSVNQKRGSAETAISGFSLRVVRRDGKNTLEAKNTGVMHARLAEAAFVGADGTESPVSKGLLGYVLPGATVSWPLASEVRTSGTLKVRINESTEPAHVAVSAQ